MQIRSFRGSGEPVWVIAHQSARFRLGPDPRRALGPAATLAASTGRTRDRTRPMLHNVRKFLPGRRPHVTVVSTGRRNTLAKSLCWRLEVQRFSGPLVELARHLVQLGLRVRGEIEALGEVLAQQA